MPAVTHDAAPGRHGLVHDQRGLGWRIGWTLAGFTPFLAISALHLSTKFAAPSSLEAATKSLEMPSLALGVGAMMLVTQRTPRPVVVALLFIGLALSWFGDVGLMISLPAGLGFFLAAHLAYIALFQLAFPRRQPSPWGALAMPWFLAMAVMVGPSLGRMLPPVVLYSAILGTMAALSTRGSPLTAAGALLFVVSDTVLAFRTFTPRLNGDLWRFVVMATYLPAQVLISLGVLQGAETNDGDQRRVMRNSGRPVSSSIVSWPSGSNPQPA
jgi:uncharacterized membrane protein YhhN